MTSVSEAPCSHLHMNSMLAGSSCRSVQHRHISAEMLPCGRQDP